jgi:cytidine deaminase
MKPGDLEEIAITASPCGGCRQWLAEWRLERVTYRRENGEVVTVTPADLLPDSFVL